MRRIVYEPEAAREIEAAATWFDKNTTMGGARFLSEVGETLEAILSFPESSPRWRPQPRFRARLIRMLRYQIFYEILDNEIRVWAIAHTSRRPGYWLDRRP